MKKTKEEVLHSFDNELQALWAYLLATGLTEFQAADYLYNHHMICYWERDALKGKGE